MSKDIVFIPGALATPKLWHLQERFFQQGRLLHYVDVLNSESIEEMACRFIPNAPPKFTLIGFSMGGYIALELYRHIPNQIEKLILINSAAKIVSEKGRLERERAVDLVINGKFDLLIKLIFKNSFYDNTKHKLLLSLAQEMAREVGVENYIKQLNAILNKRDHSTLLSSIECPTLLITSKEDRVMPLERSEHMAKNIKHAKLIYMEQCGHLAMLEQSEKLNQILANWL